MWIVLFLFLQAVYGNVTQESTTDSSEYNSSFVTITTDIYNSSDFTSDIDCNSSTCLNTTSTSISISSTTPMPKIVHNPHHDYKSSICLCDLHSKICDINCCCDLDCTYEKKKIFDHCEAIHEANIDTRNCKYSQYSYVNFTVHEWEIQINDLFCVVKKNVPPSYTIQKKEPFKNYEDTNLEKDHRYAWPQRSVGVEKYKNYSKSYIQGLPLWIISNNSTVDKFKVHEAFISSACNIRTEVKYLYDVHSECVHIVNGINSYLNVEYYRKTIFIAKPTAFNHTKLRSKLMTCPSPICLKPILNICSDSLLRNCRYINETNFPLKCSSVEGDVTTCENVVSSLKYIIYHEGLKGINQIHLYMYLVNISYTFAAQNEIAQSISIEFQWADTPITFINMLSGNPGYLIGKPILIGTLVNGIVIRDPGSYKDNFMVLPHEDLGDCQIGKHLYQPIEFGYNTILLCRIRNTISVKKNSKPSDVCRDMQLDIFTYWNILELKGYYLNRTFGHFGNANASILEDWQEILYEKSPKHIRDGISGKFTNKNKTLICTGLAIGLNIEIYHARVDLEKLVDQEKILGSTYQFQSFENESRVFGINNYEVSYEFDLDTKVTFWDVTSMKLKKLVDPPSLNIKLPADFFYPFVKMGNGCCKNTIPIPKMILVLCIIMSVFAIL